MAIRFHIVCFPDHVVDNFDFSHYPYHFTFPKNWPNFPKNDYNWQNPIARLRDGMLKLACFDRWFAFFEFWRKACVCFCFLKSESCGTDVYFLNPDFDLNSSKIHQTDWSGWGPATSSSTLPDSPAPRYSHRLIFMFRHWKSLFFCNAN